jgi:hypothetical protein
MAIMVTKDQPEPFLYWVKVQLNNLTISINPFINKKPIVQTSQFQSLWVDLQEAMCTQKLHRVKASSIILDFSLQCNLMEANLLPMTKAPHIVTMRT